MSSCTPKYCTAWLFRVALRFDLWGNLEDDLLDLTLGDSMLLAHVQRAVTGVILDPHELDISHPGVRIARRFEEVVEKARKFIIPHSVYTLDQMEGQRRRVTRTAASGTRRLRCSFLIPCSRVRSRSSLRCGS